MLFKNDLIKWPSSGIWRRKLPSTCLSLIIQSTCGHKNIAQTSFYSLDIFFSSTSRFKVLILHDFKGCSNLNLHTFKALNYKEKTWKTKNFIKINFYCVNFSFEKVNTVFHLHIASAQMWHEKVMNGATWKSREQSTGKTHFKRSQKIMWSGESARPKLKRTEIK